MHPNQMDGHLNPVKCTRMRKKSEWKWKMSIDGIYIILPPPSRRWRERRFCLLSIWMVCIASISPWIYGEIEFWTCICTTNTKLSRNTNELWLTTPTTRKINRVPQVNRLAKKQDDGDATKQNKNSTKLKRERRYYWWTQSTHIHIFWNLITWIAKCIIFPGSNLFIGTLRRTLKLCKA